jgi:hypothetical protein
MNNIGFLYLSSALVFQSADVRAKGTLNTSPSQALNVVGKATQTLN